MSKISKFIKDLADPRSDEIFFSREAYEQERLAEEPKVIETAMLRAKAKQERTKAELAAAPNRAIKKDDWRDRY